MANLRIIVSLILVSGFLLSLAIAAPAPTLAASIIVADDSDYPCTQTGLTNAVAAAVTDDPDNPGLVTFNCTDSTIEFDADPAAPILVGDFSDELDITQAVIIDGSNTNNNARITLDGVEDDGIATGFFRIDGDQDGPDSLLTLQHMIIQNGTVSAIQSNDSILNIIDVTFTNNQSAIGGAIFSELGDLTITSSTFTNNQTTNFGGGAIYSRYGTLSVSDSTFTNNQSPAGVLGSGFGGAISTEDAKATISNSTFTNNQTYSGGGAIASLAERDDEFIVTQSTFTNNQAALGGAIYSATNTTISQSTFTGNGAIGGLATLFGTLGGGGAIASTGSLSVTQSSFDNNHATDNPGGAIYPVGTADIAQSSFTNNQASTGGAIRAGGSLTIDQSSFDNNKATGLVQEVDGIASGGAIYSEGNLNTSQSSFTNNDAEYRGGAIYHGGAGALYPDGNAAISQSSFIDNHATEHGGAIQMIVGAALTNAAFTATMQITSSTFDGNTADTSGSSISYLIGQELPPDVDYSELIAQLPSSTISWSTIVQPDNTTPAIYTGTPLSLTGAILTGSDTEHCDYSVMDTLADAYTFANNDSCDLTGPGSAQNVDPMLGSRATSIISPPTQTFAGVSNHYRPLVSGSPAIDGGPASGGCDTGVLPDTDPEPDQVGTPRPTIYVCDIGAIETADFRPTLQSIDVPDTVNEGVPATITVTASDPNADTILYAIDCTSNGTLEIEDSASNQLTCTYLDNGNYTGHVIISDGESTFDQDFDITVNNLAPVITSITATPSPVTINSPVTVQMTATDVPADTLTFTLNCGIGPSLTTGTITSTDGIFNASSSCTYTQTGFYTVSVFATDDDNGTSSPLNATTTVQVVTPVTLCANQWNGSLRMADDCGRSEIQTTLPHDGPITLCVNNWNGATRASTNCSRSEHQIIATGDDSIPTCVDSWNGTLRIADRCTRSEFPDAL